MNNFELIEAIRVRKPLWDKSTWEKVDVVTREELWNEVAVKMNTTKDIAKIRWKNLRDSYRKIIRKMSSSDVKGPKWHYFKAMEFLKEITLNIKSRSTDISLKKTDVQFEADYSLTLLSSAEDDESVDPLSFSGQINQQQTQCQSSSASTVKQEVRGRKRSADDDITSSYLDIENNSNKCETSETTLSKQIVDRRVPRGTMQDDDDYQFLLSLYPHLKQVPVNRKLMLRMKIEHLIYNELYVSESNRTTQTTFSIGNTQID